MQIAAILFDKDGTLFDFDASWGVWARGQLERLGAGDAALTGRLANAIGFGLALARFAPSSPVIAGTSEEVADYLLPHLAGQDRAALIADLNAAAEDVPMASPVDLTACLNGLRARGLRLGVATNDSEATAWSHLRQAGVETAFDFVAGYDSGFGAKPEPGPLLAFAREIGIAPAQVAMVGDSRHDLHAARAAGMRAVAVLSGPATHADLAPHADVVLPHIGALEHWLDAGT